MVKMMALIHTVMRMMTMTMMVVVDDNDDKATVP